MKRSKLAKRIRDCSVLRGEFVTRSGAATDIYFDKYRFESDPGLLEEVARRMLPLLPRRCDALAGLEMGGIPVVTMLSHLSGIPALFVRKERKSYGTRNYLEGIEAKEKLRIALVEDVVTTGGALRDALRMMREDGLNVKRALCVVDREQGGREALEAEGVRLKALFRYSDILGEPPNPRA